MSESSDKQESRDGGQSEIKVTDRRMFTPEGELRDEYKELQADDAGSAPESRRETAASEPEPPARPAPEPPPATPPEPAAGAPFEIPDTGTGPAPSFYDLVGILAEPASIYLQQAQQGGEDRAQNLEIARLHVDLLDVLRKKTAGNLTAQESAALEDVLYRLRMGYVQVRD